jgi:hypothetical protein
MDLTRMLMMATEPCTNIAFSPAATMYRFVMQTDHPQTCNGLLSPDVRLKEPEVSRRF